MSVVDIARLFKNGRSQAVRSPTAYRFEGTAARVSRRGRAVILEPIASDPLEWFSAIDALGIGDLLGGGRSQPHTSKRDVFNHARSRHECVHRSHQWLSSARTSALHRNARRACLHRNIADCDLRALVWSI